ncbi:SGNH/GDSL hydrolase family protein [Nocardioides mangrovicus]|uniref:SGNH/GDSL hydrolase family protein n=1 Tax=Nocardioides mangrovicus TaxID=2478913 RepID=A0A3L8P8D4_9ACTN|nr:SGNH/GDSL hydrolase family protein [Nocardioides mangrovicus]RLV50728.1 SGNH/GDSL hydrolase family protein [Nocardioides mangrovicus]
MGRAGAARKLAAAAAYGGGGLSVIGASIFGVIAAEARIARHLIGHTQGRVPDATGWYGRDRPGPAIRMVLLGDSSAAGYGVQRVEETPGAVLASGLSQQSGRRVFLRTLCRVGARSSELAGQVGRALPTRPDVAVVLIGANDVTHGVLPSASVRQLAEAVRMLREARVEVVVGTCPDLGTVRPIPQPLKLLARTWSRRIAAAQTIVTVESGGRTVSLASILGPDFAAEPGLYFGPDRFHPSATGYASLAAVLIPSVLASLGLAPDDEDYPVARRGEGVMPVAKAAARAARTPGAELDGTDVAGRAHGVGGRWVTFMRRRRHHTTAEAPDSREPDPVTADGAGPAARR